jgi:hypothetical protein
MDEIDKIKNAIRQPILEGRYSKRWLAREAGVVSGTLTGMECPKWNPTAAVLSKLLRVVRRRPLGNGVKSAANQRSLAA